MPNTNGRLAGSVTVSIDVQQSNPGWQSWFTDVNKVKAKVKAVKIAFVRRWRPWGYATDARLVPSPIQSIRIETLAIVGHPDGNRENRSADAGANVSELTSSLLSVRRGDAIVAIGYRATCTHDGDTEILMTSWGDATVLPDGFK